MYTGKSILFGALRSRRAVGLSWQRLRMETMLARPLAGGQVSGGAVKRAGACVCWFPRTQKRVARLPLKPTM